MATTVEKPVAPAYTSYRPLITWLNDFRKQGHVPQRVDKSHLGKASGSVSAGHLAALRFLKLTEESGKPTPLFEKFVMAADEARAPVLAPMLADSYVFLFNDADFDLARASSKMLEEKFRALGISGSTLLRAVAFFLSAAKEAGLKLAPGLKAPTAPPRNGKKATADDRRSENGNDGDASDDDEDTDPPPLRFEIPIPVNRKVRISIPSDFDKDDWDLLQTMFSAYVKRWKGFSAKQSTKEADT